MNRNAVIQRFQFPYTSGTITRLRGYSLLPDYARMWATSDNGTNPFVTFFGLYGSSDGSRFNGLPIINVASYAGFVAAETATPGTIANIDIRGQGDLAYLSSANPASGLVTLTTAILPAQGAIRARARTLSTQTIVPSNPAPGPYLGTSQIVDCADVDTLSIQCADTNSTSTSWFIQGSIDGELWWDVPVLGSTDISGSATIRTISSNTFVRNLDVSGYRYVRLLLNGTTVNPFNTIATFYGEALE